MNIKITPENRQVIYPQSTKARRRLAIALGLVAGASLSGCVTSGDPIYKESSSSEQDALQSSSSTGTSAPTSSSIAPPTSSSAAPLTDNDTHSYSRTAGIAISSSSAFYSSSYYLSGSSAAPPSSSSSEITITPIEQPPLAGSIIYIPPTDPQP